MHLMDAQKIIVLTHMYAIQRNERACSIHIQSAPGLGKSQSISQSCEWACKLLNEPFAFGIYMLANFQSFDMIGFMLPVRGPTGTLDTMFSTPPWMPTPETVYVVVPPHYEGPGATDASAASTKPTWFRPGEWKGDIPRYGVVFFDEWPQADEDVKKASSEVILNGQLGTRRLPEGYRALSAGNRMTDRSGAARELMLNVNRRALIEAEPHAPSWDFWAINQPDYNRPHYLTISFAKQRPDIVFRDTVPDGYDPFPTPRSLVMMDRNLRALRTQEEIDKDEMPSSALSREFATGFIGSAAAGEYYAHLKYNDRIPTIEAIIDDPMKALLPQKRDEQLVTAYKLSHFMDEANTEKLFKYTLRLHDEMQMVCINAAKTSDTKYDALRVTPGFNTWMRDHAELLVAINS